VKILLDHCVPQPLRALLPGHDVITSGYLGWDGLQNGDLLRTAADAGFDVLLTTDKRMRYQQNLVALPLAIILINGPGTRLQDIQPLLPKVLDALRTLQPRSVVEVTP
jgi:hypothetical protein